MRISYGVGKGRYRPVVVEFGREGEGGDKVVMHQLAWVIRGDRVLG
jgi:hypothetical protein